MDDNLLQDVFEDAYERLSEREPWNNIGLSDAIVELVFANLFSSQTGDENPSDLKHAILSAAYCWWMQLDIEECDPLSIGGGILLEVFEAGRQSVLQSA